MSSGPSVRDRDWSRVYQDWEAAMHQRFERETLYREVWATPIWKLAPRYGLSGNGLKKICMKLNVPVPPRGYWAKLAAGHKVRQVPLPTKAAETVVVRYAPPVAETVEVPEDAVWLTEWQAYEALLEHRIEVNASPRRWHEVVASIREQLEALSKEIATSRKEHERYERWPESRKRREMSPESWHWNAYERGGQVMPMTHKASVVRLSLESYKRGLAILNAVCQAAVERGFEVSYAEKKGRILLVGHGGEIELRMSEVLEEKSRQVRRYDGKMEAEKYKVPTGRLKLQLEGWGAAERRIEDKPELPLEGQLNKAFEVIYKLVIKHRQKQRERQAWHERWEREARERAEARRREEEAEARREAERQRRRELVEQAQNWARAALIRRYVEARRQGAGASEDFASWEEWALAVAAELDPSKGS